MKTGLTPFNCDYKRKRVKPPTREQIETAKRQYFERGGKITRLSASPNCDAARLEDFFGLYDDLN